jgi:hypothetical protein
VLLRTRYWRDSCQDLNQYINFKSAKSCNSEQQVPARTNHRQIISPSHVSARLPNPCL